jgi:hypothetical protein
VFWRCQRCAAHVRKEACKSESWGGGLGVWVQMQLQLTLLHPGHDALHHESHGRWRCIICVCWVDVWVCAHMRDALLESASRRLVHVCIALNRHVLLVCPPPPPPLTGVRRLAYRMTLGRLRNPEVRGGGR